MKLNLFIIIIVALPILGSIVAGFLGRKIGVRGSQFITCFSLLISSILISFAFYKIVLCGGDAINLNLGSWVDSGVLTIGWEFKFDNLSISLGLAVLFCSTLIHIYSISYLESDPLKRFGKMLTRVKLPNSGKTLKLIVPSYSRKAICGWTNYSGTVISYEINEKKMGNRGSKSDFKSTSVKEQRVDGSWYRRSNIMHLNKGKAYTAILRPMYLRCTLMGYESCYQIKIPSKQLNVKKFSTLNYPSNLSNVSPWFVSGFTDAEGSFQINLRKRLNYKLGWYTLGKFRIELHKKDLELLKSIQLFFNGIGQVGVVSTRKSAYFEVTKLNDLINIIIPHFDKYSLKSAKSIDYLLWKQCLFLMLTKEHLTQSGLENIISIKAALNWGNSELLKSNFPNVKPIERPDYIISEEPLNPDWVSGFSEGDSSFIIYINKNEIQAKFTIGLNEREKPLLIKLQSFFNGVGGIYADNASNTFNYKIAKIEHLNNIIISHFNTYKLVGNKNLNFIIWSQIVSLIKNKTHLTSEGLNLIKSLKDQLNKWD